MQLSRRLTAIIRMVKPVDSIADIGCDHGFLSIALAEKKLCNKIIAADVNIGPLGRAREHILENELEDVIETRLSDGFEKIAPGEVSAFVIAGMGGPLGLEILYNGKEQVAGTEYFILQIQSEIELVRYCLREWNFICTKECLVLEDGKYYFVMMVNPNPDFAYFNTESFSDYLSKMRKELYDLSPDTAKDLFYPDSVIADDGEYEAYKMKELQRLKKIVLQLKKENSDRSRERLDRIARELEMLEKSI